MVAIILLGGASPARAQISEVQVTPENLTLRVGQKQTLFAAAFDRTGNLIPTAKFTYGTNNSSAVQVMTDGTVVGLKPGLAVVEVRSGQQRTVVAVSVAEATPRATPGAPTTRSAARAGAAGDSVDSTPSHGAPTVPPTQVAIIALDPQTIYLLPSENLRVLPRALKEDGSPAGPVKVTWKSLRPEVASVDGDGVVVGLTAGQGIIQASIPGGPAATAPVDVAPGEYKLASDRVTLSPDEFDTLQVTVPSQGGRILKTGLQWRSSDSTIVRVGPTGILQALKPGQVEIVASGFYQERRAAVLVHRRVETLVVSPRPSAGPLRVPLLGGRTISARAEASDSSLVTEAPLSWEVGDTALATFNPATATLTGKKIGTTSLSLRLKGFALTNWVVEIIPGAIGLPLARAGLRPGQKMTLPANLLDDKGVVIGPSPDVQWSSSELAVAGVGPDGTVEAVSFGRTLLTASTPWGKTATADVFVVSDLLLSSNRKAGGFGIYQLMTSEPDNFVPLLTDSGINIDAVYSADRTQIAFSSNRSGDFELYVMDADGRNIRRLTHASGNDEDPAWTAEGKQIVFTSERSGTKQIYVMNADGTDARPLTSSAGGNLAPALSPDGKSVAFLSARDGNYEVYVMDLQGGNQRNVTFSAERESSPRFFPNGDLLYAVDRSSGAAGSQVIHHVLATGARTTITTTDRPLTSLGLSRDGGMLAYVVGRLVNASRGQAQFSFYLQPLTGGGGPAEVKLTAGEQVLGPAF